MDYTDSSFVYSKGSHGYMVTIQKDFAELLQVDVDNHRSKYIRIEAPLKLIRKEIQSLVKQGYKKLSSLDLEWRFLVP